MSNEVISTIPKPFVFVLMPFDTIFADTYALGIRPACESAGAYCERVDEQIFHESILQRIYNQISKADVIVADLTARNPNVFYETGYAHALGKQVVLLTQNENDIPFDLKHYPHIIYSGSIVKLRQELERRIRWCLEQPSIARQAIVEMLEIYANGQNVGDVERITVPSQYPYRNVGILILTWQYTMLGIVSIKDMAVVILALLFHQILKSMML